MAARRRRRFTAEFKKRVALESLRGDRTMQEIAARHGVHPNQVGQWKRQGVEDLEEDICQWQGVAAVGTRVDDLGLAREDRGVDGGAGFFLRGLQR